MDLVEWLNISYLVILGVSIIILALWWLQVYPFDA